MAYIVGFFHRVCCSEATAAAEKKEMTAPQSYDFHTDPTFLLAVRHQATIVNKSNNERKTFGNVDVVQLAALPEEFWNEYELVGSWNRILVENLKNSLGAGLNPFSLQEGFARFGMLLAPLYTGAQGFDVYDFIIIPPYLALYWDQYYSPDIIGKDALAAIELTPARHTISEFYESPEKFISPEILKKGIYLSTAGDTVRSEIINTVDSVLKELVDDPYKNLYVAVFGFSLLPPVEPNEFLLENEAVQITMPIYTAMSREREETLKPPVKLTPYMVKEINRRNVEALASTESSFMNPVLVLFFESTPMAKEPLPLTTRPRQLLAAPTMADVPRSYLDVYRQSQACAQGECDMPSTKTAAGFVTFDGAPPSSSALDVSQIDINCRDPATLDFQAQQFGVYRREGMSDKEYCDEVKRAILNTIRQSGVRKTS